MMVDDDVLSAGVCTNLACFLTPEEFRIFRTRHLYSVVGNVVFVNVFVKSCRKDPTGKVEVASEMKCEASY